MDNHFKLPWIIVAGLTFIVILQIVAIIIILTNFAPANSDTIDTDTDANANENINFVFDDDGNIAKFNAICVADNGAYFKIFKAGNYEEYDSSSNLISSGNYSMVNGSIVSISPTRTLYYEGYYLADGTTIYDCEASINTGTSE